VAPYFKFWTNWLFVFNLSGGIFYDAVSNIRLYSINWLDEMVRMNDKLERMNDELGRKNNDMDRINDELEMMNDEFNRMNDELDKILKDITA